MGGEGGEGGHGATAVERDNASLAACVEEVLVVWTGDYVAAVAAH